MKDGITRTGAVDLPGAPGSLAITGALTPLKTYDCGKSPAWVLGVKFD
jgi:hypothetical protein